MIGRYEKVIKYFNSYEKVIYRIIRSITFNSYEKVIAFLGDFWSMMLLMCVVLSTEKNIFARVSAAAFMPSRHLYS